MPFTTNKPPDQTPIQRKTTVKNGDFLDESVICR